MDLISKAVEAFKNLKPTIYRLVVSAGKDKPLEEIKISFYDEDLFHILGLQHLSDIDLPKNKKALILGINEGKITDAYLEKSEYYDSSILGYNIKQRISSAVYLEEYLDSDLFTVSIYRLQHDNKTFIRADYLISCRRHNSEEEYYIFIRKRKNETSYGIVSAFPKVNTSYWGGKRYLMLKEKQQGNEISELFRHPEFDK